MYLTRLSNDTKKPTAFLQWVFYENDRNTSWDTSTSKENNTYPFRAYFYFYSSTFTFTFTYTHKKIKKRN